MDAEGIERFIVAVNSVVYEATGRNDQEPRAIPRHRVGSTDVAISCPFARFGHPHKHRVDRKMGFGIAIAPHSHSAWNCYTCKERGRSLTTLITAIETRFQLPPGATEEIRQWVMEAEGLSPAGILETLQQSAAPRDEHRVFDEAMLAGYLDCVPNYALERHLSLRTCEEWELGWDKQAERLIMPIRGAEGELLGVHGRAVKPGQQPKYYRYWDFNPAHCLYGLHRAVRNSPVIVVEGQFNVLWMHQLKVLPSAVGLFGSSISNRQIELLVRHFTEAWLFLDNDDAGRAALPEIAARLSPRLPVSILSYPPGAEDKDPAQLTRDEIIQAITQRQTALGFMLSAL